MSDEQILNEEPTLESQVVSGAVQDGSAQEGPIGIEAIRAEIQQEFSERLVTAELRARAAEDGIKLPEGITDFLDFSKMMGEDGQPRADIIEKILTPFAGEKEPKFPQLEGLGYHRSSYTSSPVSLDARKR
ncbi:hypothetical protein ACQUSR_05615 [Streptomyces sp. P1-3]|uniref:hypothetical protein n=1 Tax=Streptomyces sp. P1-3 TaxID=3421658 RepID=UPI003D36950D